jgi:hypothetical protein
MPDDSQGRLDPYPDAAARQALWRTCLHEYAHAVVARHFGAAGFVTIVREYTGAASYGGRFQMYGELDDDEWRIVALAGTVAECVGDDSCVEAASVIAVLRGATSPLSGVDAQLAAGFADAEVERCLAIVRQRWREIASEAAERAAREPIGE